MDHHLWGVGGVGEPLEMPHSPLWKRRKLETGGRGQGRSFSERKKAPGVHFSFRCSRFCPPPPPTPPALMFTSASSPAPSAFWVQAWWGPEAQSPVWAVSPADDQTPTVCVSETRRPHPRPGSGSGRLGADQWVCIPDRHPAEHLGRDFQVLGVVPPLPPTVLCPQRVTGLEQGSACFWVQLSSFTYRWSVAAQMPQGSSFCCSRATSKAKVMQDLLLSHLLGARRCSVSPLAWNSPRDVRPAITVLTGQQGA